MRSTHSLRFIAPESAAPAGRLTMRGRITIVTYMILLFERMALTRDFKNTVLARAKREPGFAQALLGQAATLFLNGESETARLVLRDLVNATLGFEQLAALTDTPSKSLHRMLSQNGNPGMDNLAAVFDTIRQELKVGITVSTVAKA